LKAERTAVLREKETTTTLRAHEVELEMLLAQSRNSTTTMKSRIIELEERVRLLEAEREQFLSGFVERVQVTSALSETDGESTGEQTDLAALAGFIAEMREKIEQLKLWKIAAQKAGIVIDENSNSEHSESISTVSTFADRFEKAGRLGVITSETDRMKEKFGTRAERSLYESSMEDLASSVPEHRKRAAECLRALGSSAASPLITAALGNENDPAVKVALLCALAAVGEQSTAALAIRELADQHPEVRAAALDATSALAKEHAEPALIGALSDTSSLVRRRAVLLLSFMTSKTATNALTSMISDRDPGVARIAAQALSGRPEFQAQSALAKALNHQELSVRQCAAHAVTSWSGEMVDPNASAVERRRAARRISEKLTRLEDGALQKAVIQVPTATTTTDRSSVVDQKPEITHSIPPAQKTREVEIIQTTVVKQPPEPIVHAAVPEKKPTALETSLIGEIRTSLRGRTTEELVQLVNAGPADVATTLTFLLKRGTISQRGPRFFMS
jgi:hypothetical protein